MKTICKLSLILGLAWSLTLTAAAQNKWVTDNAHTSIKFTATHLLISEVEGNFKTFSGAMESSKPDFTDAKINFSVDIASINTDNEMRDKHLKSDDFFNADKFPKMTFASTSFKKLKENKYELEGNLTIRDITKKVKFEVTYGGTAKDPWGNTHIAFKAHTSINRFDYNLKWNTLTEAGGAVVGKDIDIIINVEFLAQKQN